MDSYTEKYRMLRRVRKTELYFIPGKYVEAKLHSIIVKTRQNMNQIEILKKSKF